MVSYCVQKKETKMFFVISRIKLGRCWRHLAHRFLNKFAVKWRQCFPPYLNNVSPLPCETYCSLSTCYHWVFTERIYPTATVSSIFANFASRRAVAEHAVLWKVAVVVSSTLSCWRSDVATMIFVGLCFCIVLLWINGAFFSGPLCMFRRSVMSSIWNTISMPTTLNCTWRCHRMPLWHSRQLQTSYNLQTYTK